MARITVMVADSQLLVAESVAGMLNNYPDLWVLEETPTSGQDVISAAEIWTPDVLLLDHWITGMEGPAATAAISSSVPDCRIIMLSWFHSPGHIESGLSAGAVGYLPKSIRVAQLADAIRRAHGGEKPVFADELKSLVSTLSKQGDEAEDLRQRFQRLTPRETQTLILLSRGLPIGQAADQLSISVTTVKSHIRNIMTKTGARSNSEAVALALRCGWIQI